MYIQQYNKKSIDIKVIKYHTIFVHTKNIAHRGIKMAKIGRPKSDNPKDKRINLRLTKDEFDTISYVAKSLDLTMSEAIVVTMEERADEIFKIRNKK